MFSSSLAAAYSLEAPAGQCLIRRRPQLAPKDNQTPIKRYLTAGGADCAEQIGVVITLVGGLPWPRPAPGPLPNPAVFLADAGLIPKPDFDRRRLWQSFEMGLQHTREVLWNGPPLLPAS